MKIFLICPVREAGDAVNERIAAYVAAQENAGHRVHWPKRDTKQDGDPVGIRICRDNREAMFAANEVHVWYDPRSRGSCFDIGMAFAFQVKYGKTVRIANPEEFLEAPSAPQLSLLVHLVAQNADDRFALQMAQRCWEDFPVDELAEHVRIADDGAYVVKSPPDSAGALCKYGEIFATMRTTRLMLRLALTLEKTEGKSFNNVLLWLAEHTKSVPKIA